MAEQNNTSANTSAQNVSPKGGVGVDSEFHAKFFPILARVASVTAVLMYVFYFPQIIGNLNGHKGDWIQPLVAAVNCTLWVLRSVAPQEGCSDYHREPPGYCLRWCGCHYRPHLVLLA